MGQATGKNTQTVVDFESAYKTAPGSAKAHKVHFNTNAMKSTRALTAAQTIVGGRNPVQPFAGNTDVNGQLTVPVDAHDFELWVYALMNTVDSTTAVAAQDLDAAAVTDKGSGKVGLPCTGHGYLTGATVVVDGTSNYDGAYVVLSDSTANEIVVTATYAEETLAGTETVQLGHILNPDASAVTNVGDGIVGIPCAGHGLPVGARVTIAGTTNYNGTYTVKRGTTASVIHIEDTYVAETLAGTETITAYYYDKVYTLSNTQPSMIVERGFTDLTTPLYFKASGVKVGSLDMTVGGDGELTAGMNLMGAAEARSTTAYAASPVVYPFERYSMFHSEVHIDGSAVTGRVTEFGVAINANLDGSNYTLGDRGERGSMPEGTPDLGLNFTALFTDATYHEKADAETETSLELVFARKGNELRLLFPECLLELTSPGIDGPQGVRETYNAKAYYNDASEGSALEITVRNLIHSLTE